MSVETVTLPLTLWLTFRHPPGRLPAPQGVSVFYVQHTLDLRRSPTREVCPFPKLCSFCGKRMTATGACLFEAGGQVINQADCIMSKFAHFLIPCGTVPPDSQDAIQR